MVGIVGSVNGVGNSRISFCRLTFCIIRIDLFTSVHGPRRCLRISNNKGGKKWTGRETREEEKKEKPYCVARATTLLLLLQLKLHSFVRRKRAETLERESVGEEKKRVDRRGQGDGDERRGERWKGQGKEGKIRGMYQESTLKSVGSGLRLRRVRFLEGLSRISSNRILMRPSRRNGTRPWLPPRNPTSHVQTNLASIKLNKKLTCFSRPGDQLLSIDLDRKNLRSVSSPLPPTATIKFNYTSPLVSSSHAITYRQEIDSSKILFLCLLCYFDLLNDRVINLRSCDMWMLFIEKNAR